MAEANHHSIGEVLSLLKDEHADVTISKIRFFESQGLIDPERTPSGYRKFYDSDIVRLRWILTQQRDYFLPLKVIKRRMEEAGFDPAVDTGPPDGPLPEPTLFSKREADAPEVESTAEAKPTSTKTSTKDAAPDPAPSEPEPVAKPAKAVAPPAVAPVEQETETAVEDEPHTEAAAETAAEAEPTPGSDDTASDETDPASEDDDGDSAAEPVVEAAPPIATGDPLDTLSGSVSLSALELAESAGVDLGLLGDLDRLGLIQSVGGDDNNPIYDHEALVVAKAAGVFQSRGVEPRHLRMFKVAGEREAGLLEQLLAPKLQRGGEAGVSARAELNQLVQLGEAIQRSILRRTFGTQLN